MTDQQSRFIFSGHKWDQANRIATFSYKIEHNEEVFDFTETLSFVSDQLHSDLPEELLKNILDNLLLALGISYYKLFCPKEIILPEIKLAKEQADFWKTVYTKGLGEFFYQNEIDFRGLISFPISNAEAKPISFPRQDRSLVGIGGGKDSIVAAELLKEQHKTFAAFVVNSHPIKDQTIQLLGVDKVIVKREIDPLLLTLNKRADAYNGHVPFSMITAFIALFTALLYDYRYTIFANEKSANYGNVMYLGEEVNHQWSKSFAFETLFQEYVGKFITPDISYFSLLRPLHEIAIAERFAKFPQYFPVFSSCNRNFTIHDQADNRWCGECAKCAFTFVMLAAFLSKEQVVTVFGQNLFAKKDLLQTYKELLGIAEIKPFDCVGTPEEVKVAFYLAQQKGEYGTDVVMQFFQTEVLPKEENIEKIKAEVFNKSSEQSVPKEFEEAL